MREQDPTVRAILTSGFTRDRSPVNTGAVSPEEFLKKPYSLKDLAVTVQRVLQGPGTGAYRIRSMETPNS